MLNMEIKQFEIWQVNLNPTKGSEQAGRRPCVIAQTNAVSDYGQTTVVAPLTSKKINHIYPYEAYLEPTKQNGLKEVSKIKFDQIRVIDKQRLIKKLGMLQEDEVKNCLLALDVIFDLRGDFR